MKTNKIPTLFLIAVIAALGLIVCKSVVPASLSFKSIDMPVIAGLLAWLFTVALFVERSVEVIILVVRDEEADTLEAAVGIEQSKIDAAQKIDAAIPSVSAGLIQAQDALTRYRAATKELALCVAFVIGILVSLAGVRALGSLVSATDGHTLFIAVDILVTGSVLAGGSDGVHKMANVFSNFMDALASKAKSN
ncbi:MAG: hypothetical protein JF599_01075 [Verrucomicrobia bacterium]|nr:hypothetical protein [Verrucomicrobiota bacterium]